VMTYWIVGYFAGMLVTAAIMGWTIKSLSDYTPHQLTVAGLLVLFWPPWLIIALSTLLFVYCFVLFQPKPARNLT